jgi:hypothetical protein
LKYSIARLAAGLNFSQPPTTMLLKHGRAINNTPREFHRAVFGCPSYSGSLVTA